MSNNNYESLRALIEQRCLLAGDHFRLSSGQTSSFFFDMKKVTLDPKGAPLIADIILEKMRNAQLRYVGGPAMGAIPIVAAACARGPLLNYPVSGFFVRPEAKDHGTCMCVEGSLPPKRSEALMVEDVATTGSSIKKSLTALKEFCTIRKVFVLIDREAGAQHMLAKEGVSLESMFTIRDFTKGLDT